VGSVTWTEIPTQDFARAQKFYGEVFSWTFTNQENAICPTTGKPTDPFMVYFARGPSRGGLVKTAPENHLTPATHPANADKQKTSVCVTLNTDSVDKTLERIVKAGGELYK
jgi:predicted enzyme related to lactoylglutathione lyase